MRKDAVLRRQMENAAEEEMAALLAKQAEEAKVRAAKVIEAERKAVEQAQGKVVAALLDQFSERPTRPTFGQRMRLKWNKKRLEKEKRARPLLFISCTPN